MGISTSTGTLIAGQSRTFNLSPASAVTLTLSPNVRVTITETPATVAATGLGGNASRVHEPRLPGTFTYGPYPMGGTVVVDVESNSGSIVAWVRSDSIIAESADGAQSVVDGGGNSLPLASAFAVPRRTGFPLVAYPRSSADHGTITGTGVSSSYTTRDGVPVVRITTGAGNFAEITSLAFSRQVPLGRFHALVYVSDPSKLATINPYIGDTGYTNFFTSSWVIGNTGRDNGNGGFSGWCVLTFDPPATGAYSGLSLDTQQRRFSVGAGAPDFASTTFTISKIRITPQAAVQVTVDVAGWWVSEQSTLPAIVLTADDGWATWYTDALPIAEKYGLRMSQSVIASVIGTASYCTLAQLQDAKARGHECIVHGEPPGGNLSSYTTADQVAAEISGNKAYVQANNLARNGGENIYVYPQGVYQLARGNSVIQDGLDQAGITYARLASVNGAGILTNLHSTKQRRYIPIIGHNWDAGDEAANVARLILRMQQAAAMGRSSVSMNHKFVTTAAAQTVISKANFELVCAAVAELVTAGTARNLLMSEMCAEMAAAAA